MNKISVPLSVEEAVDRIKSFLEKKEFEIFADIDHRLNASSVGLEMPYSRVLIFGNPLAGTKLMQKDIFMSFDMPLRLAVVEDGSKTYLLHESASDYSSQYKVEGHPVLEKVEGLFSALVAEVTN